MAAESEPVGTADDEVVAAGAVAGAAPYDGKVVLDTAADVGSLKRSHPGVTELIYNSRAGTY